MATITIDIDEDTDALPHKVLSSTSLSASQLVCEALQDRLEEIEDASAIADFAQEPFEPVTNSEVMRRLHLN